MRTIIVKVFPFEELSEGPQEKALSELADINVDYEWWDIDGLLDLTQDEMDEVRIKSGDIESVLFSYEIREFDLERHQYLQLDKVIVSNDEAFRKFLKIPEDLWRRCSYYFDNPTCDKNTYLELMIEDYEELTEEESAIICGAVDIMGSKIHEAWVSLRDNYEYLTSEEAIKDTIKANEYEFYENGKLI